MTEVKGKTKKRGLLSWTTLSSCTELSSYTEDLTSCKVFGTAWHNRKLYFLRSNAQESSGMPLIWSIRGSLLLLTLMKQQGRQVLDDVKISHRVYTRSFPHCNQSSQIRWWQTLNRLSCKLQHVFFLCWMILMCSYRDHISRWLIGRNFLYFNCGANYVTLTNSVQVRVSLFKYGTIFTACVKSPISKYKACSFSQFNSWLGGTKKASGCALQPPTVSRGLQVALLT